MVISLYVLAFTAAFATLGNAQIIKYCNMTSCGTKPHTSCEYPALLASENCGKVESFGLTADEIQELLDVHNRLRKRVGSGEETRGNPGPQPAAKYLGPLEWSSEIAEIAQTWANQCNFSHDQCRNIEEYPVGQNIAFSGSTGTNEANLSQLVTSWYDEVELFDKNEVNSFVFSTGTGHYTQLVWANSTHLGCGAIRYNNDGKWNKCHLVCNYGPAGNWIGRPIYETD